MAPILSQGTMLWDALPWHAMIRTSCPKQRLQTVIVQTTQRTFGERAFKGRPRYRDATGRLLPELTDKRREMNEWLAGPGQVFEEPLEDSTNYLSAYNQYGLLVRAGRLHQMKELENEVKPGMTPAEQAKVHETRRMNSSDITGLPKERPQDLRPFPDNPFFQSERVLSEELRDVVFQNVNKLNGDISAVSAAFSIDVRRVAAVVRLKTIEERWKKEGKKLAKPYNDAVLAMLPQTPAPSAGTLQPHEGINDLPVHAATRNQLFYPASESRQFTREDAAKAFSQQLLPADERISHPRMVQIERWTLQGVSTEERRARIRAMQQQEQEHNEIVEAKRRAKEAHATRVVPGKRWDFKFRNISVQSAGSNGRSPNGVGIRYGMPHDDRKRGKYKLPTSVE